MDLRHLFLGHKYSIFRHFWTLCSHWELKCHLRKWIIIYYKDKTVPKNFSFENVFLHFMNRKGQYISVPFDPCLIFYNIYISLACPHELDTIGIHSWQDQGIFSTSLEHPDQLCGPPSSYSVDTTCCFHLVTRIRISGSTLPFSLRDFMEWIGTILPWFRIAAWCHLQERIIGPYVGPRESSLHCRTLFYSVPVRATIRISATLTALKLHPEE